VAGFCEHVNELSGSKQDGELTVKLTYY